MRVVIAGSRGIHDWGEVEDAMRLSGFVPTVVISGTAGGVDRLGEDWARKRGIPVERMPADWSRHGKRAGPIRNAEMLAVADAVVVVWDGRSRGSMHMHQIAQASGKPTYLHIIRNHGIRPGPARPT